MVFIKITRLFPKTLVLVIQHYHKLIGHRASGLMFSFWFFLCFCSIPQLRYEVNNFQTASIEDLSWQGFRFLYYVAFFSMISVMFILNCFADKPPRNTTYAKYDNPSPDLAASFLRKVSYQWFTRMTWIGWRRPLVESDIYDINPEDSAPELYAPFEKYFEESVREQK